MSKLVNLLFQKEREGMSKLGQQIFEDLGQQINEDKSRLAHQIMTKRTNFNFMAGSAVEVPEPPMLQTQSKLALNAKLFDVDMMEYSKNRYAFPPWKDAVPEDYTGDVLIIDTVDAPPGYAYLRATNSSKTRDPARYHLGVEPGSSGFNLEWPNAQHGPASQTNFMDMINEACPMIKLPATMLMLSLKLPSLMDTVTTIHSPYWPRAASEWVTRDRRHNFPGKLLIKQVVKYGCDFVHISHRISSTLKNNCGEEHRFSFSMAELVIICGWSAQQRIVYRTLRMIYKIIASSDESTTMCTYYFKTLMLWACEEKKTEFWHEDSLQSSVRELLLQMAVCLLSRNCPNYFISSNNMMKHLTNTEILNDVISIFRILDPGNDRIRTELIRSESNETLCSQQNYQLEMPAWLYRFVLMLDYILNSACRTDALPNRIATSEIESVVGEEVFELCLGLNAQKEAAVSATGAGVRCQGFANAKQHLERATHFLESSKPVFINFTEESHPMSLIWVVKMIIEINNKELPNVSAADLTGLHPKFLARAKRFNSLNCYKMTRDHKYLVYSRNLDEVQSDCLSVNNDAMARWYAVFTNKKRTFAFEGRFQHFPGLTPNVGLSWFVAKAFLQISHTPLNEITRQSCNYATKSLKSITIQHRWMSDYGITLPVPLTTELTAVYDSEIQQLLGFLSLGEFVCNAAGSRSVKLGVCPAQFAMYLKCRSAADQTTFCSSSSECKEFLEHRRTCKISPIVDCCYIIILTVLVVFCKPTYVA